MKSVHETNARIVVDDIVTDIPIADIAMLIDAGEIVVVKGAFPIERLDGLVAEVREGFRDVEPQLLDFRWGCEDHWRIDNNPPKSSLPKIQSVYIGFPWNTGLPRSHMVGGMLGKLRNRIAGLDDEFGFRPNDPYIAMTVYQHYPRGGGFIGEHVDPVEPQKCVINLNLPGDFQSGGLFFVQNGQKIPAEHLSQTGDLVIFRPDICHGVDAIDPGEPLDFRLGSGRWRMACVLTENEQA